MKKILITGANSYIGESFQKNNLYSNINNQINISKTNINIKSFKNAEIWDEWIISEMISTILKKYYK